MSRTRNFGSQEASSLYKFEPKFGSGEQWLKLKIGRNFEPVDDGVE